MSNYTYFNQTKNVQVEIKGGPGYVEGSSDVATRAVYSYISKLKFDNKYLKTIKEILITGHGNVDGIPSGRISMRLSNDESRVICTFNNNDISDRMIYINQTTYNPFGRSVISRAIKHAYRVESIANYSQEKIIHRMSKDQRYISGVSQTIQGSIDGALTITESESGDTPRAGQFSSPELDKIAQASAGVANKTPSTLEVMSVAEEIAAGFGKCGIEVGVKMTAKADAFKIAEAVGMIQRDGAIVFSEDEMRDMIAL